MKHLFSLIFLFALMQRPATAQQFNVGINGAKPTADHCTAVDQSNNSVHLSYVDNSYFIMTRVSPNGQVMQNVRVTSDSLVMARAIIATADDGVIVTGYYTGPMPPASSFTLATSRLQIAFATKFDKAFNIVWSKLYYPIDPLAKAPLYPFGGYGFYPVDISKSVNAKGREEFMILTWLNDGSVAVGRECTHTILIADDGSPIVSSILHPTAPVTWRPYSISYSPFFKKHVACGVFFDGLNKTVLFGVNNNLTLTDVPTAYAGELLEPSRVLDAPDVASSKNLIMSAISNITFNPNNPNPCSAVIPGNSLVVMTINGNNFNNLTGAKAFMPKCASHISNTGIAYGESYTMAIGLANQSTFYGTGDVWQSGLMIINPTNLNAISFRRFTQDATILTNIVNDQKGQLLITAEGRNLINNTNVNSVRLIKTTNSGASYCNVFEPVFKDNAAPPVSQPGYTYQVTQKIDAPPFRLFLQNIPANATPCSSSYNRMLSVADESGAATEPSVYPNPLRAGDELRVKGGDLQSVEVYNISGQRIGAGAVSGNGEYIFSGGLSVPGLYTIRLVSKSGQVTFEKVSVIK